MRAIIILVPVQSIFNYLIGRWQLANAPADAELGAVWLDTGHPERFAGPKYLCVRLEHPSFPPVTSALRIPKVRAKFTRRVD